MRVLVIVPAYNEAGSIRQVIGALKTVPLRLDVLVIDDGSVDDTANIARDAGALVAQLPVNLGIGGAVQTGFQYADQNNYDVAIQVDGDGQHDPQFLPLLISTITVEAADMVIGSRFLNKNDCLPHGQAGLPAGRQGFQSTAARRVGIRFFEILIHQLTKTRVTDPTSGLRAFNRRLIEYFAQQYPQDFPEPEAVVAATRLGCRIVEVPVVMHARGAGASSIRHLKSFYYMLKVTLAIVLRMISKNERLA